MGTRGTISSVRKLVFSLGDHTVNVVLSSLTLLYLVYLVEVAGLRPALAGLVPWVGRIVDALTDPLMGRISDRTRWRWGRRRPWFLIGAIPFGVSFALLWSYPLEASQLAKFAYFTSIYVLLSLSMTVVSVPYMALIPEMARRYDERTSLNAYRTAAGVIAIYVAVGMAWLADALGGGASGWSGAGWIIAVWLTLPWLAVYAVSWERPVQGEGGGAGFWEGLRALRRQRSYANLSAFYLLARISADLIGTMFLIYIAYVIGRREDFEATMFVFLTVVVAAIPLWLALARRFDKRNIFVAGALWWAFAQLALVLGGPAWPREAVFAVAALVAVGYAVAELMPWSMLPDVIDEDEAATGERREGLFNGSFTFLRKICGATAILLTGVVLDLAGFTRDAARQPEAVLWAIRVLIGILPALLLVSAVCIARGYPLTREVHDGIRAALDERAGGDAAG